VAPTGGFRGLSTRTKGAIVSTVVVVALVSLLIAAASSHTKRGVPLFIFAGQSNMVGVGSTGSTLPADLRTPRKDAQFWDRSAGAWSTTPVTHNGVYGPEVSTLRRLADKLHRPVLGVKVAENSTSLATDWNPSSPNGYYAQMRSVVSDALLARVKGEGLPEVAGFFWMQGEQDAQQAATAEAYSANLNRLISQVRTDFSADRLPFVIGRIRVNNPATEIGDNEVRAAEDQAAAHDPNVKTVSTDDLTRIADFLHFDGPGLIALGNRFADGYLALKH
jgi:hypothetical protein